MNELDTGIYKYVLRYEGDNHDEAMRVMKKLKDDGVGGVLDLNGDK